MAAAGAKEQRMKHLNWWYVGGFVVTTAAVIAFTEFWSLDGLAAFLGAWGILIVSSFIESRTQGAESRRGPAWFEFLLTAGTTCALLGLALVMSTGFSSRLIENGALSAPALTGILLLTAAAAIALTLVVLVRRARASAARTDVAAI